MKNEQVLVVPEEFCHLDMFKHKPFANLLWDVNNPANSDVNLNHLECNLLPHSLFMDRTEAEQNPKFKQLIPYCLIKRLGKAYNEYFVYQRTKKAGETRLHGNWSVGIGGHLEPYDSENGWKDINLYNTGLAREILEETGITDFSHQLSGFIYDDSNSVGKVHLGIVHIICIDRWGKEPVITEDALCNGRWCSVKKIDADRDVYENWSKICLDNVLT